MKEHFKSESPQARGPSGHGGVVGSFSNSSSSSATAKSIEHQPLADFASIIQHVIAGELQADDSSDTPGRAAFRVCGSLRLPLSSLIGVVGFRSLFARALTLATDEVPWLDGIKINADGMLEFSKERDAQLGSKEAALGGTALIMRLLDLLIIFIGEALTLRLLHNVWPKAANFRSGTKENSHEKNA